MMGTLGNVRRGGRPPSLLMAALITCVLLLCFNYWVSNSRNSELQSRILELEGHMRELAADRDREQHSKLMAMEDTRRQNEQMELLEETHQRQQENTLITWKHERDKLKLNISSSIKTVQDMKNRMKSLMEDVNKMQSELKSCESNMDTLKKSTSEMTQCNKQIEAMKDECNAKIAAAKLEKQKTSEKVASQDAGGSIQKVSVSKAKSDVPATNHSDKNVTQSPKGKPDVDSQSKNDVRVQTNKLVVKKDEKDAVILEDSPIPTSKLTNKNETPKKPAKEVPEAVVDVKAQASKAADTVMDEAGILDPKEDDMVIGDPKKDDKVIGDPKKDDMGIGDPKEDDMGIGDPKEDDMGIGDPNEDDMGIGDPMKDDMVIGDPKKDDMGIGDPKEDDMVIGEPKKDDMGIGDEREEDANIEDRKEEDAAIGKEDAIMYDNEGEIEKQLSKIKDENQGAGQELEDDVANYIGDDENQPESEDELQAELAEM
uniref:Zgc:56525 n=1 Tax=Cyprinus carpio TaxID=7962 RepID=A0A8C1IM28_CYPCA